MIFAANGKGLVELEASDDPLIWTPSAVDAELHRILTVVDSINNDMSVASKAGNISSGEWNTWYGIYLTAHNFLTSASTLWGSNVKTAREYENEAAKWRDLIKSRGGSVQGPSNLTRQEPDDGISWLTVGITLGGVVGAALLFLKFQKSLKPEERNA